MSEYICSVCGSSASISKKIAVNGVVKTTYYCNNCNDAISGHNNVNKVVSDIFSTGKGNINTRVRTCSCGLTNVDMIDGGKFGCAECYNTFRDVADEFLSARNLGYHKGKSPTDKCTDNREYNQETEVLDMLKKEFARAMIEERYLDVDVISNRISDIENNI